MRWSSAEPRGRRGGLFPRLYDFVLEPAERVGLAKLRYWLAGSASGSVLEIGAGTGLNFRQYQAGARVVAVDPDLAMLTRSRDRAAEAPATIMVVAADAEALPFRDETFDTAVVGLAMCTIPHPDRALEEMRRALRAGGEARLLEHVRVDTPVVGRLQDWLTPLWQRVAGGCHLDRRTVETVGRSGFRVEEVRRHAGGHFVGIVATPAAEASLARTAGSAEELPTRRPFSLDEASHE